MTQIGKDTFPRLTIAIDFDGVLHSYTSKWTKASEIHDGPVEGALEFVHSLLETGWIVVIHTSRAAEIDGAVAVRRWLVHHGFPHHRMQISQFKPPAAVYLDDRAVRFEGDFEEASLLINNKRYRTPWNRK